MLKVSNRDVSTQSDEVTQAPPLRAEPGGKKTSESVSAGVTGEHDCLFGESHEASMLI